MPFARTLSLWGAFAATSLTLIGLIALVWEYLRGQAATPPRRALSSVALYFLNQGMLVPALGYALAQVSRALHHDVPHVSASVQFALALLMFEATTYLLHRLAHRIPLLYRLHRMHHTPTNLHWLDGFRQHPLEFAYFHGIGNLPAVLLLGGAGHTSLWVNVILRLWTAWLHARGPLQIRGFHYIFTSPAAHHLHHKNDRVNYGGLLALFDRIGGTAHAPRSIR
jgi:sterol desaturase/sphingolipid hydroxylase (fatty acid hydroxylase superfamily)